MPFAVFDSAGVAVVAKKLTRPIPRPLAGLCV